VGKPLAYHQPQFLEAEFLTVFQLLKMSWLHSGFASGSSAIPSIIINKRNGDGVTARVSG
jgi:hypothetical protein